MTGMTLHGRFAFDANQAVVGVLDDDTNEIERDVKVFRVGTFTDMFGKTATYTHDDLDLAVANFRILRDRNILPNVPIRVDHTFAMRDVGGYIADVRRDGDFLVADLEFTDEATHSKFKRKHLRNRSLEIGQYVTNDGEKYNPVVIGLAFVDLPAVEGLYHLSTKQIGENMDPTKGNQAEGAGTGTPSTPPSTPPPTPTTPPPTPTTPPSASDGHDEDGHGDPETPVTTPEVPPTERPEQPENPPVPENSDERELVGAFGRQGQVFAFRVNGSEAVTDPTAVQRHIDTLEAFRTSATDLERTGFIDSLAANRVLTGPQAESFRGMVTQMSPEMFAQFREGYGNAPEASLFGRHETSDHSTPGAPSATPVEQLQDKISILEGVILNFKRLGKTEEEISRIPAFVELQTLRQQHPGS